MAEVRTTVNGQGFLHDTRSLEERVQACASQGRIAPESLTLSEIRMLCEFAMSMVKDEKPERDDG